MHYSRTCFILSAVLVVVASDDIKEDDIKEACAPIHANLHDPLRCRERDGEGYKFDDDCCAGSDSSGTPTLCANSFKRTEEVSQEGVCGQDHEWCQKHGCRHYYCERTTACVEYVGCYKDNVDARDLPFKALDLGSKTVLRADGDKEAEYSLLNTVSECANHCREANYAFAALQGPGTCWCGDEYGKHGEADERLCDKKDGKAVATRCGDGDAETCADVNAVYRLTGEDKCCDYKAPDADAEKRGYVLPFYVFIGPIVGGSIALCMMLVPCIGGLSVYFCVYVPQQRKKRERQAAAAANPGAASVVYTSTVPATTTVMVVSDTTMDPASQKKSAEPQPPNVNPML